MLYRTGLFSQNLSTIPKEKIEMRTSRKLAHALLALFALVVLSSFALAADPGLTYPPTSEVSDQKQGAVLVYNIYPSGATSGNSQNTRINITNTSTSSGAAV